LSSTKHRFCSNTYTSRSPICPVINLFMLGLASILCSSFANCPQNYIASTQLPSSPVLVSTWSISFANPYTYCCCNNE
jgi:hypothetical protein